MKVLNEFELYKMQNVIDPKTPTDDLDSTSSTEISPEEDELSFASFFNKQSDDTASLDGATTDTGDGNNCSCDDSSQSTPLDFGFDETDEFSMDGEDLDFNLLSIMNGEESSENLENLDSESINTDTPKKELTFI